MNNPTIITISHFVKWTISKLRRTFFGIDGMSPLVAVGLYVAGALIESLRRYLVGGATVPLVLY